MRLRLTVRGVAFLTLGAGATWLLSAAGVSGAMFFTLSIALLPLVALAIIALASPPMTLSRVLSTEWTPRGTPINATLTIATKASIVPALTTFEDTIAPALGQSQFLAATSAFGPWEHQLTYPLSCANRGVHRLGPASVTYVDPFRLCSVTSVLKESHDVKVTPRVLDVNPSWGNRAGNEGKPLPQIALSGHDDVLVRDHRVGDDLRRVHWPSTAKHSTLMVRLEEPPVDPSAGVILDTRERAFASKEAFEWAVDAVASIACAFVDARYKTSLFAGEHAVTTSGIVADDRLRVLDVLTRVQTGDTDALPTIEPADARSLLQLVAVVGTLESSDVHTLECARVQGVIAVGPAEDEVVRWCADHDVALVCAEVSDAIDDAVDKLRRAR